MFKILSPSSIAVIGASSDKSKVGYAVFNNLLKSKLKVYPINPNARSVLGVKCYDKVTNIKGVVDVAVIAVPAKVVPLVINECGLKGVKEVIIISAGFKEAGNKELEEQIKGVALKYGMRLLGPNVLGVIKPGSFNASFLNEVPKSGGISFISQSGALGVAVLDWAITNNIGFSYFISIGNMCDINFNELITDLNKDSLTKVIALYVESISDGPGFMRAVRNSKKPVLVLKAGTSSEGTSAVSSHTGSLAGNNQVYEAAFNQCGAISVKSFNELVKSAELVNDYGLLKGKRVLIVGNAGGPSILMTDACINNGLVIPRLPVKVKKRLDKVLPSHWSHNNPIDVLGDALADRYEKVFNIIKNESFYDAVIVILTPQSMTEVEGTAKAVIELSKKRVVIPCFLGGNKIKPAFELFKKEGLLCFNEINEVADSLKALI
ncbi:MAG: CoA-binding protein [Candidatus Nanoarchaeia archaeon]